MRAIITRTNHLVKQLVSGYLTNLFTALKSLSHALDFPSSPQEEQEIMEEKGTGKESGSNKHVTKTGHARPIGKYLTVHFLPGGLRTLVRGAVPQGGPAFQIIGQRFRFRGHVYFQQKLEVKPIETPESESSSEENAYESSSVEVVYTGHQPEPFSMWFQVGCQPHPYAIVYGLLKPPGATVSALLAGHHTLQLRRVHIPASMHARGTLVYAVLPTLPEKLIVRSARGRTIVTENLGSAGKEHTEICEGETEE